MSSEVNAFPPCKDDTVVLGGVGDRLEGFGACTKTEASTTFSDCI